MRLFAAAAAAFLIFCGQCLAQAPLHIAGLALGGNIAEFQDLLDMKTALPVRYAESINEVEILPSPGFRSGLVAYGSCTAQGKVLRIKLKYEDATKKFYGQLLNQYKRRLGQPTEWRGDPFHIVEGWKWAFTDTVLGRVSLILQHNTRDEEEKMGNVVKLTLTEQMEKEIACHEQAHPRPPSDPLKTQTPRAPGGDRWDGLVPR